MAGPKARTNRAAALHRRAAATVAAATTVLDETRPAPADQRRQYELADRLRGAAALLAPGWAGAALETVSADAPCGEDNPPFVRIGVAAPLEDARFPALVPLLGSGHLTLDADVRDPRVRGLLRAVLLRMLAATPAGCLLVRGVDGTAIRPGVGASTGTGPGGARGDGARPGGAGGDGVFAPFAALADAGLLPPPAADVAGLRAVLTEAEQWVTPGAGRHPVDMTGPCCW